MELSTRGIQTQGLFCQSDLQITLEEDVNVPDTKPDIDKLIKTQGEIQMLSVTPADGKVNLRGNLSFTLLYITSGDMRPLHSMQGRIPMEESINMDGLAADCEVTCRFELEDCQTNVINSRKVSVRAIVSFHCCQERENMVAVGTDLVPSEFTAPESEVAAPVQGLHCLYGEFALTQVAVRKKDVFRIRDAVTLPKGKPNVDTVLYYEMFLQNLQNRLVEEGVRFVGDLQLFVLYVPENEERRVEYLETELAFDGVVPCGGCDEGMVPEIEILSREKQMELKADEDGENRVFDLEMNLNLSMKFYQDETVAYLADAYSTDCSLVLQSEDLGTSKLLLKNQSTVRMADRIHIEEDGESISQICNASGTVQIDEQEIVEDGILLEGAVALEILYLTENEEHPLALAKGIVPFTHTIEIRGISPEDNYGLQSDIAQISVLMLDNREMEAKSIVNFTALVFTKEKQRVITQISEEPLDLERLQEMPGLVGFIADREGALWDIAKEYNTTVENIMQINHLESDCVKTGDRLLLLKQVEA